MEWKWKRNTVSVMRMFENCEILSSPISFFISSNVFPFCWEDKEIECYCINGVAFMGIGTYFRSILDVR